MWDFSYERAKERARQLAVDVYKAVMKFSNPEADVLAEKIQEVAVFMTVNLAVGPVLEDRAVFKSLLLPAIASAHKLDALFFLASRLDYLEKSDYEKITREICEIRVLLETAVWHLNYIDVLKENGD